MKDEKTEVGVITEIDGVDAKDINRSTRENWASSLCDKLESLDGITDVIVDSASRNFQTVVLHVRLEGKEKLGSYDITPNLRSVSQRVMHCVREDKYAGANIVEPQIVSRPEKTDGGNLYDKRYYRIEVSYP